MCATQQGFNLDHMHRPCELCVEFYVPTLMAYKSPVVRFLARYTLPKAPREMGFSTSKSSMPTSDWCALAMCSISPEGCGEGAHESWATCKYMQTIQ